MAEQVLTDFIRALRSAEVRVSTSEAIDAVNAVKLIGYGDRTRLADTLRCVLAKSPAEKHAHDRLFELYFSRQTLPEDQPAHDSQSRQNSAAPDLLTLTQSGDEAAIAMALEQAAQDTRLADIRFSTQVPYFAQQMLKAMGLERLEAEMMTAFKQRTAEGDKQAAALIEARKAMLMRARQHAQQAFDTFGVGATEQFRQDILSEKSITQLDRRDLERIRALVAKMAKRLASKHSRRARKNNRGKLDLRKTLRANAGHDGIPFDLSWKRTRRERPKIVAICDVSGSVAQVVRFFLMLIYSLNDTVPEIESYAFSGHLEDIGPALETENFNTAMDTIIHRIGMRSTDYGQSLADLKANHWQAIDRRTTLIVLGDGRSNYGDPRVDLFAEAAARAKRTIWLCPEPESQWGTGDSEMLRYRPYCNRMVQVATLKGLERVIDEVLEGYA